MLSTFNLPGKNISPDKQMAMMRTYLSELKDEIESELYNIRWENLSKSLQDRISSLESYKDSSDDRINSINAHYVDTEYLNANYITAQQISATYVTASTLAADEAIINGQITALSGDITELSTKKLDATTAYIDFMEVTNWVSAGYIRADKIKTQDLFTQSLTTSLNIWTNSIMSNVYMTQNKWWTGDVAYVWDMDGNLVQVAKVTNGI